jgi:hypothetical protein
MNGIIGAGNQPPWSQKPVSEERGGLNGSTQHSAEVLSAGISMARFVRERVNQEVVTFLVSCEANSMNSITIENYPACIRESIERGTKSNKAPENSMKGFEVARLETCRLD